MTTLRFSKLVVAINGGVPLALLAYDALNDKLGADPTNFAIRTTGYIALLFLIVSLVVTPVRRLSGWNTVIGYRRSLGLWGFGYACSHLVIYTAWNQGSISKAASEIFARPYLQIGFVAILLMLPLAITSTDGMIRRFGPKKWKLLHRLAYIATALGVIHYFLQTKSVTATAQPITFGVVLAILLLARLAWFFIDRSKKASRMQAAAEAIARVPQGFDAIPIPMAGKPAASRRFWQGELSVVRTFDETPAVRTFRLALADGGELPFDYQPGQYLTLKLQVGGKPVSRSYTIASSPSRRGYCELTVKREEMGVSSGHLHRQIKQGDKLRVAAPAGRFVFTGKEADSVVLIAGGVGITPLMSIVRYLTDHSWAGEIYLIVAARAEADIIFRDELEILRKRFPNLHLTIALSRADAAAGWTGERGRLTPELLQRVVPNLPAKLVYLCGPDEMMSGVRQMLAEVGVLKENVKLEAFVSTGSKLEEPPAESTDSVGMPEDASAAGGSMAAGNGTAVTGQKIVQFAKSNRAGPCPDGISVLDTAEMVGVEIPFECRSGVCGQCKTKLLTGSVQMDAEEALSKSEKASGWILACQSHPVTEMIAVEA